MRNQSLATKLKNAPLWWHVLFLAFVFGFSRNLLTGSLSLGSLLIGAFLVFLIGPVWLIPIPEQSSWVLDLAITILLVVAYYSPLLIIKRGERYRGILVYSRKWIRLFMIYLVINFVSACVAVPLAMRQMNSEDSPVTEPDPAGQPPRPFAALGFKIRHHQVYPWFKAGEGYTGEAVTKIVEAEVLDHVPPEDSILYGCIIGDLDLTERDVAVLLLSDVYKDFVGKELAIYRMDSREAKSEKVEAYVSLLQEKGLIGSDAPESGLKNQDGDPSIE